MALLKKLAVSLIGLSMTVGCGEMMIEFGANTTVNVMLRAGAAFDEEYDVWLAETAATGNLKFAEGILKATPENGALMTMLAKSYANYAFAFIEDDLEQVELFSAEETMLRNRATDFYERARRYATMRMSQDFEDFATAVKANSDARLDQILAELNVEEHTAPMYWLAFSWGASIGINSGEPDRLADLTRVKKLMGWVRDNNPGYSNGGPMLFFGSINTAIPKQLGGKPETAKDFFDKGIAVTEGKYLMGKVMLAWRYMRVVGDRAGYVRLLKEVLDTRPDVMPSQRLANELAHLRAKRYLALVDEYFDSLADEAPTTPGADDTDDDGL